MIHNIIADLLTATPKQITTVFLLCIFCVLYGFFSEKTKRAKIRSITIGSIGLCAVIGTVILQATLGFSGAAFSINENT